MEHDTHRRSLLALRAELKDRDEKLSEHLKRRGKPLAADWEEQAQELENEETVESLYKHIQEELASVDQALARIDSGTYGTCSVCASTIEAARLETLPTTALCVVCAQESGNG